MLREIGAGDIPQIRVYNKIDACGLDERSLTSKAAPSAPKREDDGANRKSVWVSARESRGLDALNDVIRGHFRGATVQRRLRLPASAGRLRARLYELGAVIGEYNDDNGDWLIDVSIAAGSLERLWRREGLPASLICPGALCGKCNVQADLAVSDTPKAS